MCGFQLMFLKLSSWPVKLKKALFADDNMNKREPWVQTDNSKL